MATGHHKNVRKARKKASSRTRVDVKKNFLKPHAAKSGRHAQKEAARKMARAPHLKTPALQKIAPHRAHGKAARMWKTQLLTNPNTRQMLINLAGEHTLHIIGDFEQQMSDEEIAKKTKLRTSDVRVVLNKLHSCGLVSYSRSRDKNSGWYSYVWKMNNDKAKDIISQLMCMDGGGGANGGTAADVEGEAYRCQNCNPERSLSFEEASDLRFRCAQCGTSLEFAGDAKK